MAGGRAPSRPGGQPLHRTPTPPPAGRSPRTTASGFVMRAVNLTKKAQEKLFLGFVVCCDSNDR